MPPRRRTSNLIRKPRVAGLTPAVSRSGGASDADAPSPIPPVVDHRDAAWSDGPAEPVMAEPAAEEASTIADEPARAAPAGDRPAAEPLAGEALFHDPSDVTEDPGAAAAQNAATETRHLAQVAVLSRAEPEPERNAGWRGRVAAIRARPVTALAVALAVFAVLAIGFAVADRLVRSTASAANTALADIGTTTDVVSQLNSALETVYSYDFTQLDDNERLARDVITPAFATKFEQLFGQVRQLAPQQQAVVSATVTTSAVQSIDGDRAVLVAFLDQQATRANPGSEPQQVNAAGRLTVIGELVDGTWKIAEVINR